MSGKHQISRRRHGARHAGTRFRASFRKNLDLLLKVPVFDLQNFWLSLNVSLYPEILTASVEEDLRVGPNSEERSLATRWRSKSNLLLA